MSPDALPPPFVRFGPAEPAGPVVVAVPHAGRAYPSALLAESRLTREALETLEDRYADLLVGDAVAGGATLFVATAARAWIDLNRDPRELDPAMVAPPPTDTLASLKVRGGLGLIPRRVVGHGDIYPRAIAADDVAARLRHAHRPWHEAVATALAAARARFGIAILVDLHSMPPLPGLDPARLVIGDLHQRSAAPRFTAAAARSATAGRLRPALNTPYAGGYTLERHGRPREDVHALQIELCRDLYLDAARRVPSADLPATRSFVARLVQTLAAEALRDAIAAE